MEAGGSGPRSTIVPVYREMIADLDTPVSTFLKLREGHYSFLLESVEGGERLARYSFVGSAPLEVLHIGGATDAATPGENVRQLAGEPLSHVEARLSADVLLRMPGSKLPEFTGGAIGYVAYDAVRHFEPRTAPHVEAQTDVMGIPESVFMLVDTLAVFDHVRHTITVVAHCRLPYGADGRLDTASLRAAYAAAVGKIDAACVRLAGPVPTGAAAPMAAMASPIKSTSSSAPPAAAATEADWEATSNTGRAGYMGMVSNLKGHIVDGDIIQAVPSHRVSRTLPEHVTAFDLYRQLRVVNPSPYMFYLELGPGFQIVGASPEMLVKVDATGSIFTHPIAGTRRRGATPAEDEALAAELLADEKERAEHVMLVDLGRNDVGRVAAAGTVHVDSLMHIERYSHVMHIVSNVSGKLAPGKTAYDAFRSIFPAGTVSGAPKVRAMELVAGLEKEKRHVYAGAVGYIGYTGVMDTAIAIRTMVVRDQTVYLQAGAGIVFDSDPAAEYDETCAKLRGVMRAVEAASGAAGALPLLSSMSPRRV